MTEKDKQVKGSYWKLLYRDEASENEGERCICVCERRDRTETREHARESERL